MLDKRKNSYKVKFLKITLFILIATVNATAADLYQRETPVVRAVRKVSPAVVNISSELRVKNRTYPFSGMNNPFFDNFFRDFFDPGIERYQKRSSLGSGVIIDGDRGFILTNAHVISLGGTITVVLNDEREFTARIVGADPDSDLAVLRIDSESPLPSVGMGTSQDLMIGETVIAIGNPFGFSHTVTTGVVSAVNRSIRSDDQVFHNFIQIDASINPGNSGGPLLNINGELIGINSAIYAKAQGIGFAIPIDTAKKIVSDLIRHGEVVPAWIGLTVQDINPQLAGYLDIGEQNGVMVQEADPDGPAFQAGIRRGDVLLTIGNQPITESEDYHRALRQYSERDNLRIRLFRNGKKSTVIVAASVFPEKKSLELAWQRMGIRVSDLPDHGTGRGRGVPESGVVITDVRKDSYLGRIGAQKGDIIRQLDDISIDNLATFKKTMVKYRQKTSVVILLQRGDQGYYITVRL